MKRFASKLWAVILGLVFVGVCLLAASLLVKNRLDQEAGGQVYVPLNQALEYKFIANHDDINIIILRLKNPGLQNKDSYEVQIKGGDNVLATQVFSGRNVGDPSDIRFQFPPLPKTKNQTLTIRLTPHGSPVNPILVEVQQNGSLSFQAFYRSSQISFEFVSYLKDYKFLLVWGATIALLILYV